MAISLDAKISLISFLLGCNAIIIYYASTFIIYCNSIFCVVVYSIIVVGLLNLSTSKNNFQVAVRGYGLGIAFAFGLLLSLSWSRYRLFGWHICMLAFFHWSEYFATAVTNPRNLSLDSYLLNHSREYHIAAVLCAVEFIIESLICPSGWKEPSWLSVVGLLVTAAGESLRKAAMLTAMKSFNHYVVRVKRDDHQLITHGIYSWCRHPAYVGWFYWSIGTQIILKNPFCAIAYAIASWRFFNQRILEEEISLLNFFDERYIQYQRRVGTGLPFIRGVIVDS